MTQSTKEETTSVSERLRVRGLIYQLRVNTVLEVLEWLYGHIVVAKKVCYYL